jgi:hypothetical protein
VKEYKLYQRKQSYIMAEWTHKKLFNTKNIYENEKKKIHTELSPFYRLGILLFLSLFFTAFSLSLFIAPNTAAPKK